MAKIDMALKRIFVLGLLVCVVLAGTVEYFYFSAQHRQAQREVIYWKARQQAAEDKRAAQLEYQKRLRERELSRQYRRGRVIPATPAR